MDAEGALGPADDEELIAGVRCEKKVNFFAGTKFGRSIDVGVQMLKFSAELANDDFFWEIAFVVREDAERGIGPDFAVLHAGIRVEATHTSNGIGVVHQILDAQPHQRGGLCYGGDQGKADQKKEPEEPAAVFVAHD
jgi:hypothetical protein